MRTDEDTFTARSAAQAARRSREAGYIASVPLTCPDCSVPRRTAETLRAHRIIAHGLAS